MMEKLTTEVDLENPASFQGDGHPSLTESQTSRASRRGSVELVDIEAVMKSRFNFVEHEVDGPGMNLLTHCFTDPELEKAFRDFFAFERNLRLQRTLQLLFLMSLAVLIRAYVAGAEYQELLSLHVVNTVSGMALLLVGCGPTTLPWDMLALVMMVIGFVASGLAIFFSYESNPTNSECNIDESLDCRDLERSRALIVGMFYTFLLLVAATTLRRFPHYLVAAFVLDVTFGELFLDAQTLGNNALVNFVVLMVFFTIVLGFLNRSLDMMMRREYLWQLDMTRMNRVHLASLEAGRRQRAQVVAYLFHEIRNPINNVSLASHAAHETVSAIASKNGNKNHDEHLQDLLELLDVMTSSARTAGHVLTDALDLERLAAGSFAFVPSTFSPREMWESVVSSMQIAIDEKGIKFSVEFDNELDALTIEGDLSRLQQVVRNFLHNSVKFTPEGGMIHLAITKLCEVQLSTRDPDWSAAVGEIVGSVPVRVAVSDTGPGIKHEDQGKLFQPFSQIRAGELQGGGGTGLGLSLSKEFIQAGHNGKIGMISPGLLGEGSTFYFDVAFPIATLDSHRLRNISHSPYPLESQELSTRPSFRDRSTHFLRRHLGRLDKTTGQSSSEPSVKRLYSAGPPPKPRPSVSESTPLAMLVQSPNAVRSARGHRGIPQHEGGMMIQRFSSLGEKELGLRSHQRKGSWKEGQGAVQRKHSPTSLLSPQNWATSPEPSSAQRSPHSSHSGQSRSPLATLGRRDMSREMVKMISVSSMKEKSIDRSSASDGSEEVESDVEGEMTADILLVEDSPMTRKLMGRLISSLGLTYRDAENGQIAVDMITEGQRFKIVFMDKEMPQMDGHEATVALRQMGVMIPIVGITGNGLPEQQAEFIQCGATKVVVKPVGKQTVMDVCVEFGVSRADPDITIS